jgi:hypothetical protein
MANWAHEVPFLARELVIYHSLSRLAERGLAPKLLAYAYEGSLDRITGFLVERMDGSA